MHPVSDGRLSMKNPVLREDSIAEAMAAHTFNLSTWEAETGDLGEFEGCTEKPYLIKPKTKKEKKRKRTVLTVE